MFVMSDVVDTRKSGCDEKIRAWESNDQVCMVSGSSTHVTEFFPGILQRRQREEKTTTPWRCSSCRNSLSNNV